MNRQQTLLSLPITIRHQICPQRFHKFRTVLLIIPNHIQNNRMQKYSGIIFVLSKERKHALAYIFLTILPGLLNAAAFQDALPVLPADI